MIDAKMAPTAALVLRLTMGLMFLREGFYLKIVVYGFAGTGAYFQSLGLPGWLGDLMAVYETIGGICLVLGIQTRWVLTFLGLHLLATVLFIRLTRGVGLEFPVFWAIVCFSLALLGDGACALMPSVRPGHPKSFSARQGE